MAVALGFAERQDVGLVLSRRREAVHQNGEVQEKMSEARLKTEVPDTLDILQIMDRLPHRYPFLMIDRLEEIKPGESACGIKNVTVNEPCFQGHFPKRPVMPGVLIVEAMAQTAAVLVIESLADWDPDNLVYFMTIDDARFRRPVIPGDCLRIYVVKQRHRGPVWRFTGSVKVNDVVVAEASFSAMIVEE